MRFSPLRPRLRFVFLLSLLGCVAPICSRAEPVNFSLPAQPAADSLLGFSQQAGIEVLFSFDELRSVPAPAVNGRLEPDEALRLLLQDTGFIARRNARGKFVVTPDPRPTGSIQGRLLLPNGSGATEARVYIPALHRSTQTDRNGDFLLESVPPGLHRLQITAAGFRTVEIQDVLVEARAVRSLAPQRLRAVDEIAQLEPYVVRDKLNRWPTDQPFAPRAAGNLDLPRTENDPLPYKLFTREQISRSGVVNLNEFLQRELLDSNPSARPPEQDGSQASYLTGSSNLALRGFDIDETVVLLNGRRLPEVLTIFAGREPPDVNLIPLSMVQEVQVLPASASALYSGNPVGGVINIILRQDANASEINTTYTNAAARGFDAPQTSVSLVHGRTLLDGKLRVRLNATFAHVMPPTESELHYRAPDRLPVSTPLYRATPNVRSVDGSALFGSSGAPFTSAAPGADGSGGLSAFAGRAGVRSLDLFAPAADLVASTYSNHYPYGRRQDRAAYFGSVVYDALPWLQIGVDGFYARTTVSRGLDVFTGDLELPAASSLNPFGKDVMVSLNETAPALGERYSQARIESASIVGGLLLKLPRNWSVSVDAQYARNVSQYRGVAGVDAGRWQELVDQGRYNPLRDTQRFAPPQEFYDRVVTYFAGKGRFATIGDYDAIDSAVRVRNEDLLLPTGKAVLNVGADYRRNHLAPALDVRRFGDGTIDGTPTQWAGRAIQRYSGFGELQAPLLPATWLPRGVRAIEADVAVRYIASDNSSEANIAPTIGVKVDFRGGFSFRGSATFTNRFPNPYLTVPVSTSGGGGGGGSSNLVTISDPLRGERYDVQLTQLRTPSLSTEAAATQTAGLIFQRSNSANRFRAALDFIDTRKRNELVYLDSAQSVVDLEALFPDQVVRAAPAPGDTHAAGVITEVFTREVNAAWRHSQNWNLSLDYAWNDCAGGTLATYARWIYFQSYKRQFLPTSAVVDELSQPDTADLALLRHRGNFGVSWTRRDLGFGIDGHYFHSRLLPLSQRAGQGRASIAPFWQFDAFAQSDLTSWLPGKNSRFKLRAQFRVNNVFGTDYPRYLYDAYGAGVQSYGDWRGRTYSLSLNASF